MTRIFPNRIEPLACAFQRQQLAALSRRCDVEVLATVPYFPGCTLLGDRTRAGRLARVPAADRIDGLSVVHPRVAYVPGAAVPLAPLHVSLYLAGLMPHVERLRGRCDVVVGGYLHPDACAAALLAWLLGVPYAVKGHGTDVNVVSRWRTVEPVLRRVLRGAACVIGVSRPMVERLVELGARRERTLLVRNGVNRAIFQPAERASARVETGLADGRVLLYVGRLEPEKGLRELVVAFERMEGRGPSGEPVHLVFVGDGTMRRELEEASARLGARRDAARGRIVLAGGRPLPEVARFLAAADALVLPSWNEGTPNVILEALAAGRPVVATRVGGIPDILEEGRTGLLVPPRDERALVAALRGALAASWDVDALVAAAPPSWDESAADLHAALARAGGRPEAAEAGGNGAEEVTPSSRAA